MGTGVALDRLKSSGERTTSIPPKDAIGVKLWRDELKLHDHNGIYMRAARIYGSL
jgi:hypothetical protein